MKDVIKEFEKRRAAGNDSVSKQGNLLYNRFFNLDSVAYKDGALNSKTKHLIGLSCSLMLRCEDCTIYHIKESLECGSTKEEINEAMSIALLIGGSAVVPELRKATQLLEELTS